MALHFHAPVSCYWPSISSIEVVSIYIYGVHNYRYIKICPFIIINTHVEGNKSSRGVYVVVTYYLKGIFVWVCNFTLIRIRAAEINMTWLRYEDHNIEP